MDRFRFQETGIFKKPADLMQMFRVSMKFPEYLKNIFNIIQDPVADTCWHATRKFNMNFIACGANAGHYIPLFSDSV